MSSNVEPDIGAFRSSFKSDLLEAIGLMVVASSMTEHALHIQCQRLMSHPNQPTLIAVSVLSGAQVNVTLNQIRTLVKIHITDDKLRTSVTDILDRLRDKYTLRNEIVHGAIVDTKEGVSILRLKMKNGRSLPPLKRNVEFIDGISSEMLRLTRDLDIALTDLHITPLPKRFS